MIDWIDTETFRAWLPELKAALRILIILVAAWVAQMVVRRVVRRIRIHFAARANGEEAKRIETLGRVIRYTLTVLMLLVAGMLILNEVGVSIAPILGAAGVVGVAVGFGAQSLIKDYFTGFFLLVENQIRVGDVVEIADKTGLVEEITLRRVRLRGYDGSVHYVSNGLITTVTNMSTEFAQAVIDVGIAYKADIDAAFDVIRQVARDMRAHPQFTPRILDDLDLAGVESLADSAVVIRCRIKVLPLEQWSVRREFNKRVKEALDRAGIEIPFPHRTIYFGNALPMSGEGISADSSGS
jgi:moderate conductance mechanosensitive channel